MQLWEVDKNWGFGKEFPAKLERAFEFAKELCNNSGRRLYYHHWDDNNMNMGMWICGHCHTFAEWVEKGWSMKYQKLKETIESEMQVPKPQFFQSKKAG